MRVLVDREGVEPDLLEHDPLAAPTVASSSAFPASE